MNIRIPRSSLNSGALLVLLVLLVTLTGTITAQEPGDEAPVEVLEPDVGPELINFVEAEYPPLALREGREGTVLLDLLVTAEGRADSVLVARSLAPDLDAAAVAAVEQFVFSPAEVAGEAVPVYVQFEYTFSINEQTRHIQEYVNFQGVLREMGTRTPLEGAMVVASFPGDDRGGELDVPWNAYLERIGGFHGQFLEEGRLVTFADEQGRFAFKSLPPGVVVLTFPNSGYEAMEEQEKIHVEELVEVEYWARRSAYNEYEIVVYGRGEEKEVSRQSLSVTEVERIAGFGGDVIKSIQALPGVARPTMEDPGAIVIRGSGNYDTRFFLDGIDIPLLFHYGGLKSTYNSLALGSVDMYPGGFGTSFGNCIGGVVELRGRAGRKDKWHTVLDASMLDASFHTEGPLNDKFSLTLSARRSFIGEIMDAALSGSDDFNMAMAPYYWDVIGRLDYGQDTDHHLFATAFASKDKMSMVVSDAKEGSAEVSEATDEISMDMRFSRYILGYNARLNDRMTNTLRAAYGRQSEEGHVFGEADWKGEGPLWQVRNIFAAEVTPYMTTVLGGELLRTPYEYSVKVDGWERSTESKTFGLQGAWANLELRPIPELLLIPGIRYDYYDHLDKDETSYRFNGRYQYHPERTVTASLGTYNQHPQPIGQATDPVYGNPDLPPTKATHVTLGHEMRLNDRLSLKVEGYYNTQELIPTPTDSLGLNFVPDTDARMYGIEFMLRHEPSDRFFGWISYSLGRAERRYDRRPSTNIGPDWDPDSWQLYGMDQTHHIEAVGSWNLGRNWSFGTRIQYVSGVPMTPLLNYTSGMFEFDADTGEYQEVGGEYFSERMSPYFKTDLRVDKKWIKNKSIWSVYLDLQNANYFIYNSPEGYTYNYDSSKRNEYGFIFMPTLGARVEF